MNVYYYLCLIRFISEQFCKGLDLSQFTKTTYTTTSSNCSSCTQEPCTSSNSLTATFTFPNAYCLTFNCSLSTETAGVFGMLSDFKFLDLFSQRCTITSTVFTGDSYLFGMFRLQISYCKVRNGWMDGQRERERKVLGDVPFVLQPLHKWSNVCRKKQLGPN